MLERVLDAVACFFSSVKEDEARRSSEALSHCESVGCGMSIRLDKAEALAAGGSSIRLTIYRLLGVLL